MLETEKLTIPSSALDADRNFNPTEKLTESTAHMSAISVVVSKAVILVNKSQFKAEKDYQASMICFRHLLSDGIITLEKYKQIDTILLEKYQPLLGTLFCGNRLT